MLQIATLLAFERDGHVTTPQILRPAVVEGMLPAIAAAYESQTASVLRQKLRVILGRPARPVVQVAAAKPDEPRRVLQRRSSFCFDGEFALKSQPGYR